MRKHNQGGESARPDARGWLGFGLLVAVVSVLLLGGCASGGGPKYAGESSPDDVANIPDAVPRVEPRAKYGNMESYVVFGKRYHTKSSSDGYVERGLASWYGPKFHGRNTSSGERYDMYGMTAAHKTLPLPTYARVTNLENGRSAVVKINDRGPFHGPRVIDLSYAAATKLGVVKKGTAMVEVRAIDPTRPESDRGPFLAAAPKAQPAVHTRTKAAPQRSAAPARPAVAPAAEPEVAASEPKPSPPLASSDRRDLHERAVDAAVAAVSQPSTPDNQLYLQVGAFGDPVNAERLRNLLVPSVGDDVRVHKADGTGASLYKVRVGPLATEGDAERVSRQIVALGVNAPRRVWN